MSRERRVFIAAIGALALFATLRVGNTWRIFSETLDEPIHLVAGYDYWTGTYSIDLQHPPLARALAALPIVLMKSQPPSDHPNTIVQGNDLLYGNGRYDATLARVRAPLIIFLLIAIAATAAWAFYRFDRTTAIVATLFFTALPPVLAHAALVTTDMALVAGLTLAFFALDRFLERRTTRNALLLGAAIGFGLLTKMSFLLYFPPAALILFAALRGWRRAAASVAWRRAVTLIFLAAFMTAWLGYKLHYGKPTEVWPEAADVVGQAAPAPLRPMARWIAANVVMPAPSLFLGVAHLAAHNSEGHDSYLFGEYSRNGWWYYFPVVFFYKTPIPLLLFAAWGLWLLLRARDWRRLTFALIPAAILIVAMSGSINIGLRHVLPMYAPLAILAAFGAVAIWRSASESFARVAVLALSAWLVVGSAVAHPDYLSWFNVLAGEEPGEIAIDSNLDWGQDTYRLARFVRENNLGEVQADYWTNARLDQHGIRTKWLDPHNRMSGWVIVGETPLRLKRARDGWYHWLDAYQPAHRIGDTIRVYSIP